MENACSRDARWWRLAIATPRPAAGRGPGESSSDEDPVCRHRPSVDVLFRSVAEAAGSAPSA